MEVYNEYTIEVVLKSPVVTPFQSDTLFGHICWAIKYLKWDSDDKLGEFLNKYDSGTSPLLISNGFPKGYISKPVLPPVTQDEIEDTIGSENRIENSFKLKTIKKLDILPKDEFIKIQGEKITPLKIFKILYEKYETIIRDSEKSQTMLVQHNTVDRIEGTVKKGLYSQEEMFHTSEGNCYEIYLKTNYYTREDLNRIFHYIEEQGYGRDKSTGKGYFSFDIKAGIDLPESNKSNAFMTLSSYIPVETDPTEGNYNILLKYGKLGGTFAKGTLNGNPFKKPLIMFSSGSSFLDEAYETGKNYGSLLKNVHHDTRIRHYAYAFPVGINI